MSESLKLWYILKNQGNWGDYTKGNSKDFQSESLKIPNQLTLKFDNITIQCICTKMSLMSISGYNDQFWKI